MIGPWQALLLLFFLFPLYLVFYKRNIPEHPIPVFAKIVLIFPSITWVGIAISLYIMYRKKGVVDNKTYKFDKSTRNYGKFLLVFSLICVSLTMIYKTLIVH